MFGKIANLFKGEDPQENVVTDPEDTTEEPSTEETTEVEVTEETTEEANASMISVSAERLKELEDMAAELLSFGDTVEARTTFRQQAEQDAEWVKNMREAGITLSADASTLGTTEAKSYENAPWNKAAKEAKAKK